MYFKLLSMLTIVLSLTIIFLIISLRSSSVPDLSTVGDVVNILVSAIPVSTSVGLTLLTKVKTKRICLNRGVIEQKMTQLSMWIVVTIILCFTPTFVLYSIRWLLRLTKMADMRLTVLISYIGGVITLFNCFFNAILFLNFNKESRRWLRRYYANRVVGVM